MKLTKTSVLLILALLLSASFVLLNFGSSILFAGHIADFTADKRLSLRPETEKMLSEIKTPLTVRLYVSAGVEKDYPQTWQFSRAIIRLLEQYQNASNGAVSYDVKYPEPFDEVSREAEMLGLKSFYGTDGKNVMYFGALVMADRGDSYVFPSFVELRRNYLESDLNRILLNLNEDRRPPKIGVIAPEQQIGNPRLPFIKPGERWNFLNQLTNDYQLVPISPQAVQIGADINTLIVVMPSYGLPPLGLYALDQFVLRGGNLILLVDSLNEHTNKITDDKTFKKLLENWGIYINPQQIAGDKNNAEEALFDGQALLYYPWINLPAANIEQQHLISRGLNSLIFRSPLAVNIAERDGVRATPLAGTSDAAGYVPAKFAVLPDKAAVLRNYREGNGMPANLVWLLEGNFKSFFTGNVMEGTPYAKQMLEYLPESLNPGKILIIGDTDFIYDDIWSDAEYTAGNPVWGIVPWADNGDLLLRAVDYMSGSHDYLQNAHRPLLWDISLRTLFRNEAGQPLADAYNNTIRRLKQNTLTVERLQAEEKISGLTLDEMQQLDNARKNIAAGEDKIREFNYKIEQETSRRVLWFIFAASALSLLTVLGILFSVRLSRSRRRYRNPLEENHE